MIAPRNLDAARLPEVKNQVKRPRGVLLDLGGTILREDRDDLRAGVQALLEHPLAVGAASVERSRGGRPRNLSRDLDLEAFVAELAAECDRVHTTNVAGFTILKWLRGLFPRATAGELEELELTLWLPVTAMHPMPGVETALIELRRHGIRTGVVSNAVFSGATIAAELRRHGLREFFEFVLSSADIGARKPESAIFREALSRLGLPATDVWFTGDVWGKDVVGAAAVGIFPFWLSEVAPPAGAAVSHQCIRDWAEFLDVFRRAVAES